MKDKKLKLGMFMDSYFPMVDGVIVVVDNYAKNLIASQKMDVFVGVPGKEVDNKGIDYKVLRCKMIKGKNWAYGLPLPKIDIKYNKKIMQENPDIVHIHSPFGVGKSGIKLAKKKNVPVVATMHSQFHQDFYKATKSKFITKRLVKGIVKTFNKCDEVFVMNEKLEELIREYGYKGKIRIIPNATDMDYPKEPQKLLDMANKKYKLKAEESVFLFVGRLIENKGVLFIIDAIKELVNKGVKAKMIFVGDGPEKEKMKQKIKVLGLENNVILAGKVMDREHLASLYLRASLFLFPSVYDTDGLVRKEAGANKTPSLLAEGTLASNLIKVDDTGFLAPYEPKAYANKIYEIINNKELLKKVSENVYAKEYLGWKQVAKMVKEAYKEIIENYKKSD